MHACSLQVDRTMQRAWVLPRVVPARLVPKAMLSGAAMPRGAPPTHALRARLACLRAGWDRSRISASRHRGGSGSWHACSWSACAAGAPAR